MLMDEPFSGLDIQLRDSMQEETLALLRETRATSLIVTHNPEEAMRLGDRIVVLKAGRIVQAGTTESLYRNPASLFVARLFSEINEIPVRVAGGEVATAAGSFKAPGLLTERRPCCASASAPSRCRRCRQRGPWPSSERARARSQVSR